MNVAKPILFVPKDALEGVFWNIVHLMEENMTKISVLSAVVPESQDQPFHKLWSS